MKERKTYGTKLLHVYTIRFKFKYTLKEKKTKIKKSIEIRNKSTVTNTSATCEQLKLLHKGKAKQIKNEIGMHFVSLSFHL